MNSRKEKNMVLNQKEKKAIEILDTFELRKKTKNYKEISLEEVLRIEQVDKPVSYTHLTLPTIA